MYDIDAHHEYGLKPHPTLKRQELQTRAKLYNNATDSQTLKVKSKEVSGILVLEGPLRVHWGVQQPIQLKEKEGGMGAASLASTIGKEWQRRSYCMAINNGLSDDFLSLLDNGGSTLKGRHNSLEDLLLLDNGGSTLKGRHNSLEDLLAEWREEDPGGGGTVSSGVSGGLGGSETPRGEAGTPGGLRRYNTVSYKGDHGHRIARRGGGANRRLSMINGHIFHSDTSIFLPSRDSVSTVTINSCDPTPHVIKLLLHKFKVENDPDDYCLCVMKKSGETRVLAATDFPLVERLMLGPLEEEAKIIIQEKRKVHTISEEVAPFVNLPNAVLEGFLNKYKAEHEQEIARVKMRYGQLREMMKKRLSEISTEM